jgi:glycosyltransferase involved in cell wall biosynthesis
MSNTKFLARVVYDVSVLGMGHHRSDSRTGVFRVVENLARGLQNSHECDLCLCASYSRRAFSESFAYWKDTPSYSQVPLLPPRVSSMGVRTLESFAGTVSRSRVPAKFGNKVVGATWRIINSVGNQGLFPDLAAFGEGSVYHSPYMPLPEEAKNWSIPRFLTLYDMIPVLYPNLFGHDLRRLFHQILASIQPDDWVLAISESTKRDFCEMTGFPVDRVFVTHPASAPNMFYRSVDESEWERVRQRYGVPDGPYVLSLNTLEPRKNVHTAIDAFTHLVDQGEVPELYFVLAGGNGWDNQRIWQAANKSTRARERIHITGYIDDNDLASLYSHALMFVYVPLYEGFGLPPLEAMQCGVPVIVSNTSSLPEVVGDSGLLVDPLDRDNLSDEIRRLYSSNDFHNRMSGQSLDRAALFSWERCARETIAAYRIALDTVYSHSFT